MRNLHGGRESCHIGLFGRYYAVLIVIALEKAIHLCLWVPLKMNSRFSRKTQRQIFLLVSWRHVHPDGYHTKLYTFFGKSFLPISCIWKLYWPESLRGSLHIYLLLFSRYWTLFIKRFWSFGFFLFLMAWKWKPAISVSQAATGGSFFRMLFTNSFCRCCYAHDMCYRKLQQKEACGKSYHIVQLYLAPYLRRGCSGCGKYAPWSNCNKAVKNNRCVTTRIIYFTKMAVLQDVTSLLMGMMITGHPASILHNHWQLIRPRNPLEN